MALFVASRLHELVTLSMGGLAKKIEMHRRNTMKQQNTEETTVQLNLNPVESYMVA